MKRNSVVRRLLLVAALLAAGLVAALRTDTAGDAICTALRRELPKRAGVDIGIGQCRLEPLSQSVKLTGVSVFAPGSDEQLLSAEEAEVSLRGVFLGSIALDDVRLTRPRVAIDLSRRTFTGPAAAKACPLKLFDRVKIDSLAVKDAQVELLLPDHRALTLDGLDVDWATHRGVIGASVSLRGGRAELGPGKVARLGQALIDAELDVGDETVSFQRASLSVDGITLNLTGSIEALCDSAPRLALNAQTFVPVVSAMRLATGSVAASGTVWSRVSVTGRASAPTVRAEVQGSEVTVGRAHPGDFTARVSWSGNEVVLEELSTKAGQGSVKLSGALKLESGLPVRLKFETQEASLARILERAGIPGAWVDLPATARGSVGGNLMPRVALQGDADVKVGRFVLTSRPFDAPEARGLTILTFAQGHTDVHLAISNERVELTNIQAQVGPELATRVSGDVTLNYDQEQGLAIHAKAEQLELSDFGHIAGLPWKGRGTAQVSIVGPYRAVAIEGQLALRDFELMNYAMGVVSSPLSFRGDTLSFEAIIGQKGRTQYFGDVGLAFRKEGLHISSRVQVPRGHTEDLVDVIAGLNPALASFQNGVLTGDVSATGQIDSMAAALAGTLQFDLKDTRYYGRRLGDGPATMRFLNGEALALDSLLLKGPLGTTSAEGRWFFSGPLDFQGRVDSGALAELLGPSTGVSGPFKAEAKVEGDTTTPVVKGTLSSAEVLAGTTPLGPAALEAQMVGKDLEVHGTPIAAARGQLKMKIKEPYPYDGKLSVQLDELRPFLPAAVARQGLNGAIAGTLTASGDLRGLDTVLARADLDRVTLQRGDVTVTNDGPVQLGWAAGRLDVSSLSMKGTNTELSASGSWGPTTADMKARGAIDLRLLDSFVPQLERLTGKLDLTATMTGSVKDPAVVGSADVRDARFQVKDQALAVRALSGRLEFSKARVLLQGFEGFLNDGRIDVRGDLRLDGSALKQVEIGIDVDQVTVLPRPELPATLTGSLLFYGKPSAYQLSGGLDVTRFKYTTRLDLDGLLKNVRASSLLVSEAQEPVEWLRYDVDLQTGPDVRIDNNLARSRLTGKVKLAGTNIKPQLIGVIEAGEGSQGYFRGNVFSIGRGTLQFSGPVPTFDLTAQSQVRDYLVNVKAFGRLDDPRVSFSSQPPLSEADILTLLTVGVTSKEEVSSGAGASLAAEALLSASGLDEQVQRFLSKNSVLKDQQVHLSTTFNPASGKAEPSVSWESKLFSDQLKVGVTQPVSGKGTKAQAEYRFNDRVSARAQWDNQTDTSTLGNPGFDLKFHFEWE